MDVQYDGGPKKGTRGPLTHGLVVGQKALVEHDGAVLLIGEVCVEGQQHLVSFGYKLLLSWGVAQWRTQLATEPPQGFLISRDLVEEGQGVGRRAAEAHAIWKVSGGVLGSESCPNSAIASSWSPPAGLWQLQTPPGDFHLPAESPIG